MKSSTLWTHYSIGLLKSTQQAIDIPYSTTKNWMPHLNENQRNIKRRNPKHLYQMNWKGLAYRWGTDSKYLMSKVSKFPY